MRNKVRYNKSRCTKYMVNIIGSTIMTLFTGIMIGVLITYPIVSSNKHYEEVVSVEDLKVEASEINEITNLNEEKLNARDVLNNGNAGVAREVAVGSIYSDSINSSHIALSGGSSIENNNSGQKVNDILPCAGVAAVLNGIGNDIDISAFNEVEETEPEVVRIRCTGYNDVGYTKSGEWTRQGIIAGKKEWLGKKCNLYRINEDESIGELIGTYEFLDTGYGINGSLIKGTSIDVWHPSEDSVWDWMAEYGDYVYMEGPY